MNNPIPEDLSLEDAQAEMESMLELMESGKASLEEMVAMARRGEMLLKHCHLKVLRAERLVEELVITPDGELATQPLEFEDDDAA